MCGQVALLPELYNKVYMPSTVKAEILAGGNQRIGIRDLNKASWLHVESAQDKKKLELLYDLDRGEAEVIILAKEKNIQQVLIDERVARLEAKILNLEIIGTLGILLKAKKKGLIAEIKPLIYKMLDNGIWIKEGIVQGVLSEVGESETK